ncbi:MULTISPECIES: SMP-30/gluconolactonase/LRE family protein [unclassified Janthinobacterium]|uniref:SMP-30/gluconolactonase/LRE family protein n=1 Tax=unclassified Janthinobacterium TaxID=2610881 RepID=UPI00161C8224|nr:MULTISPECIES: SMP-30/gluconolactonase/LRE family protein [unclassified Janthinobacterium]MBB5608186.1 sugar lactone lactonase YvrE [Janthinobacterium sp. S3T4]MBB5613512.1 sugar lactone lactonase YvrE [Janthinobacterium sp. S3M3]
MLVILALAAYLSLWPVPIHAVNWQAPVAPGYVGVHAPNSKLTGRHHILLQGEQGPEHIVFGPDGKLYTAVASGKILRMDADGGAQEVFATTGGRSLGLAFDAQGNLIAADAVKGLLSIAPDGKVNLLSNSVDGHAIRFTNAVVVASTGKIYFTESSTRFTAADWGSTLAAATLDVMEQSATGRVLEYDPATQATRIVAYGLSLANGIALSADEQTLLMAESGRYRVWKIAAQAAQLDVAQPSEQASVLLDNLPGYPDNLMRGLDGKLWLGLAGQRNELDAMDQKPFLRQMMLRIPQALWPLPKPYGHVMAFTEDGQIVADLQDPSGTSPLTTGITETRTCLYLQAADGKSLDWLER